MPITRLGPARFAAYKANNIAAGEIWNSDQKQADTVGKFAKFNSPTVANGKVYVPTFSKAIKVYGTTTTNCVANGTGITAEYFTNTQPSDPFPATATVTKTEPTINFDWASGPPRVSVLTFSKQGLPVMYKALTQAPTLFMLLLMMASGFG